MKKAAIFDWALMIFLVVCPVLHGTDPSENVIRRAYTSIDDIQDGKIFVKPDKLSLKEGVIYIEDIDGGVFSIPVIFSSAGKPYLQVDDSILFNSWKCECGAWNHKWDNPTHCWKCGRPR